MNPNKVRRERTQTLTDLPNVGPAIAKMLNRIGIDRPCELSGCDPFELYERLYKLTGKWEDPCLLDVFMSVVRFMNGEEPQVWWSFTQERKKLLASKGS